MVFCQLSTHMYMYSKIHYLTIARKQNILLSFDDTDMVTHATTRISHSDF